MEKLPVDHRLINLTSTQQVTISSKFDISEDITKYTTGGDSFRNISDMRPQDKILNYTIYSFLLFGMIMIVVTSTGLIQC